MEPSEARRRLTEERRRLSDLREQEAAALEDEQAGSGELTTVDQHPADAATQLHDREVDESVLGGLETGLAEVDEAFDRLDDGTYGRCQECGEPIADERLEAVPATRFCARHQPSSERVR